MDVRHVARTAARPQPRPPPHEPTQKLELIASLNRAETERQAEEIRAPYGDVPDEEMRMRPGALRLGRETMIKVFGWDPDEKG